MSHFKWCVDRGTRVSYERAEEEIPFGNYTQVVEQGARPDRRIFRVTLTKTEVVTGEIIGYLTKRGGQAFTWQFPRTGELLRVRAYNVAEAGTRNSRRRRVTAVFKEWPLHAA